MRRDTLGLVAVLLATVAATLHKLGNAAVWDDAHLLGLAESLRQQGAWWSVFTHSTLELVLESDYQPPLDLYRPIGLLSFELAWRLGDGALWAQHALNSALHAICVALVYAHARRWFRAADPAWSLLPAAWFGLTPVFAEAHVWISGRFDLCATAFGLGALLLWRDSSEAAGAEAGGKRALAGGLFLLGLFSKETLLFALPALWFFPGLARAPWRRVESLLPFVLSASLYLAARATALGGTGSRLALAELAAALRVLPALWLDGALHVIVPLTSHPRSLAEDYASLGEAGLGGLAVAAVLGAALLWRARRTSPVLAWSALWFACTLAPVALVAVRPWPGFGRFLYLPGALWLVGGALWFRQRVVPLLGERGRRVVVTCALVGLLLLATSSHRVVYDWADSETLYTTLIERAPGRSHGYGLLGIRYVERGRFPEAVALLRRAHRLAPAHRGYASRLGTALLFLGEHDKVLALAETGIARYSRPSEFHLLAAYALLDREPHASVEHVLECLARRPEHAQCREALRFLGREHPRAAHYRHQLERLLRKPRYAALRELAAAVVHLERASSAPSRSP